MRLSSLLFIGGRRQMPRVWRGHDRRSGRELRLAIRCLVRPAALATPTLCQQKSQTAFAAIQ